VGARWARGSKRGLGYHGWEVLKTLFSELKFERRSLQRLLKQVSNFFSNFSK
jgi:hypothetical protein